MRDINESDWKILRQLHPQALERFCEQILLEVEAIRSDGAKSSHQQYLAIHGIMQQRNEEMAQIFDNKRRSTAFNQLADMKFRGLLIEDEYSMFSRDTRQVVARLLSE